MNRHMQSASRAACAAVALIALASCSTLNREGVVAPQDGGNVVVRQGAPFVINLAADPATGYGWVLTSDPGDAVWLIGGPDYTPDPLPAGLMGVGGTTTYRFRAEARGRPSSSSPTCSPGNRGVAPTRTARYDVTVKSAGWQNWF